MDELREMYRKVLFTPKRSAVTVKQAGKTLLYRGWKQPDIDGFLLAGLKRGIIKKRRSTIKLR